MRVARTLLCWGLIPLLLLGSLSASAIFFNVAGPPQDGIDGNADNGVEISLNSYVGGIITRDPDKTGVIVSMSTSAVFSDNLQIFLVHNGISVELYRGEGNGAVTQINGTFSQEAADSAPPTGTVSGTVLPVGDLDRFRGRAMAGIWTLRVVDPLGVFDGTDLNIWTLSVDVDTPNPSRSVALFYDPNYVDTFDETFNGQADAEALNIRELLRSLGHDVETFGGTSQTAFATALAGKDVLIIPSIEGPDLFGRDLFGDLSEAARNEIRNFVAGGGNFITHSSLWSNNGALVKGLFGWGEESADNASATILDAAIGSPFQGAPGIVSVVDFTRGLQNLPAEAKRYYQGPIQNGVADTVAMYPYPLDGSGGKVIWLGSNYWNMAPLGFSDQGWPEIMNRAVVDDLAPFFSQQTVALFNDPAYVDTVNDAANLEASLIALGHDIRPFTGTSLAAMTAALADADVLVIADPELADPQPALEASGAEAAMFDFVSTGGVLIMHAASSENLLENILARDPLFSGDNAVDLNVGTPDFTIGNSIGATVFQNPGAFLEINTNTDVFTDMPSRGASMVYTLGNITSLGMFRVGAGNVFWFGWDWEDASQDEGWSDALGRAITAAGPIPVPELGGTLSALAAWFALAGLRRARHPRRR